MDPTATTDVPTHPLRREWLEQPERFAGKRQIQIAEELGVSEGEWVEACRGHESIRLRDDARALLEALPSLGEVMVLTRNASAVHEKVGAFGHIDFFEKMHMAQVVNHEVDLRMFLKHWHRFYAVAQEKQGELLHSLQVFDTEGRAVHKIFRRPETDGAAWDRLVARLASDDGSPFRITPVEVPDTADPESVDAEAFRRDWDALKDTHEFFFLLRRFNLARTDALRLAGGERARPVDPAGLKGLLERAAADRTPIMVFVGNRGCIQIHTGPVETIVEFGPWLNVMDPGFNLHLRLDQVAEAWVVRKPTTDGVVTSVELYDAGGREIAMMFGERKPGTPELEAWRDLAATL